MDIDEEEHGCILAQDITGELSLKLLTKSESCGSDTHLCLFIKWGPVNL
jgi:hypothetical protein